MAHVLPVHCDRHEEFPAALLEQARPAVRRAGCSSFSHCLDGTVTPCPPERIAIGAAGMARLLDAPQAKGGEVWNLVPGS